MNMNHIREQFKIGDHVVIKNSFGKKAKVVGYSRDGHCCWVVKDGNSQNSREVYHKFWLSHVKA